MLFYDTKEIIKQFKPTNDRADLDWSCKFWFVVTEKCQSVISLQLKYRISGQGKFQSCATSFNVNILTLPTSNEPTQKLPIAPFIKLSDNSVSLFINTNGENEWMVQGISLNLPSFEGIVEQKQDSYNLFDYAENCLGKLLCWLRKTIDFFQGNCNIILVDKTSQQINWEMVRLDINVFLGIKATVIRWLEKELFGKSRNLDLTKSKVYEGCMVPYVHLDDSDDYPLSEPIESLEDWQDAIINNLQAVAVASLQCNGHIYAGSIPQAWQWEPIECQHSPIQVDFEPIFMCNDTYPLCLFVNAPYSARLIWDNSKPCGIAAVALSQVASGYIGSMGAIDPRIAKLVKNKFIVKAREDDGVKPAEFLREIRSEWVDKLKSKVSSERKEAKWGLPHIFSYVYYGNPDDVVKITGGGQ